MNKVKIGLLLGLMAGVATVPVEAQVNASDSVQHHVLGNRLSVGGYGEIAYSRNFYSDNVYRYSDAAKYKNDPSHGRFDVPHAVIYLNYNFGKGWTMGTEIEFEHTGTGSAQEKEFTEGGEWEMEVEKGGEVELEQFWIQKSFSRAFNIRAGHIVVPIGMTNAHHEPLHFFTVYRPEGEATILPCTWHDTGISFWGRTGRVRYEAQVVAGLDAFFFDREGWVNGGAGSPYEFKVANKYGFIGRLDYYAFPGLRIGLSGYYGRAMHHAFPHDLEVKDANGNVKRYDNVKGTVAIGAFDFAFNRFNYDIFSQVARLRADDQKFYLFARYEYYNSYIPSSDQQKYEYTGKQRLAVGFNYFPLPQIVVKGEYSTRLLKQQYNNEPSISLGIAYEGFFL